MSLSDQEVRHLAIELLTAETDRDRQITIGASNLANGCSYCLACALRGISRDTAATDRAYLGRVIGTALHSVFEQRVNTSLEDLAAYKAAIAEHSDGLDAKGERIKLSKIGALAQRYPDILTEHKIALGIMGTYGPVGSTVDLVIPSERHGIDWKGTSRKKLCILVDYLATSNGRPAPYGRAHKEIKLSETKYAEAMAEAAYKVTGYYAQTQEYADGLTREGIPIDRFSLVFVARDGTGWFDNPTQMDYEHPTRMHDVFVLSFDYDPAYAAAVWARGLGIWEQLEAGASVEDFPSHELCFPCGLDRKPEFVPATIVPMDDTTVPIGELFAPVVTREQVAAVATLGEQLGIEPPAPPARVAVDGMFPALVS